MFTLYILYSGLLNRYYVGYTGNLVGERLEKHLANHKGFTGKQTDWVIVYTETYDTKAAAIKRENEIKKWKSRKMIEKLISSTE